MAKTLRFNTGRSYTAAGQRITATLHDDGVVTYHDHDRMMDGEFKLCGDRFDQAVVMQAYDYNVAKNTRRSWQDAFLRGGCNSQWQDVEATFDDDDGSYGDIGSRQYDGT